MKKRKKVTDPVAAENDQKVVEQKVETPAAAEAAAPVYGYVGTPEDLEKRPVRKGFETVLLTELQRGAGTAQQLTDRLLASGEYQRVAPKAAELRPTKPVQFLLTKWVGSGRVAIASAEEAAIALNAAAIAAQLDEPPASAGSELPGEGSTDAVEATTAAAV